MSLIQMSAECEKYFLDNWSSTPIHRQDTNFEYDSLDKWIALAFNPTINQRLGSDRILHNGLQSVFCYHRKRILAIKLADEVATFFKCKDLPYDIRVDIGQYGNPTDIDNGFWEVKVNFAVAQY